MFYADVSKSKEISRWQPIDEALHDHFSATKMFLKNLHNSLSEGLTFFPFMGSTISETKLPLRFRFSREQAH